EPPHGTNPTSGSAPSRGVLVRCRTSDGDRGVLRDGPAEDPAELEQVVVADDVQQEIADGAHVRGRGALEEGLALGGQLGLSAATVGGAAHALDEAPLLHASDGVGEAGA